MQLQNKRVIKKWSIDYLADKLKTKHFTRSCLLQTYVHRTKLKCMMCLFTNWSSLLEDFAEKKTEMREVSPIDVEKSANGCKWNDSQCNYQSTGMLRRLIVSWNYFVNQHEVRLSFIKR